MKNKVKTLKSATAPLARLRSRVEAEEEDEPLLPNLPSFTIKKNHDEGRKGTDLTTPIWETTIIKTFGDEVEEGGRNKKTEKFLK